MERSNVLSDELHSVGYNSNSNMLEIEFKNGDINQYFGVPVSLYNGLIRSSLKSEFFHNNIEDNYIMK